MAIRNVVLEGDEILRKKCREITEVNERIVGVLDDMVDTMRENNGVGLAGPQVGMLRRMFVAEPEPGRVYYMVNPVITSTEGNQNSCEGCLSVPGLMGDVVRPEKITIEATNRDGQRDSYEFEGFDAIVMCHEYDHLDGILYTDKATKVFNPDEIEEYDPEEE